MKRWFVVLVMLIIAFQYGCRSGTTIPEQSPKKVINSQQIEVKDNKDLDFQTLKESGLEFMKSDQLTKAIDNFTKALIIKSDKELEKLLEECYFERGEYYVSIGNTEEALNDLKKCNTHNLMATNLINSIDTVVAPIIEHPANQKKLYNTDLVLSWNKKINAISYEIQIENQNWDTIVLQKLPNPSLRITDKFTFGQIYYWRIRAVYSENSFSDWSEKIWFSVNPPRKKSKIILKNPANGVKLLENGFQLNWEKVEGSDYYEVQIENENWQQVDLKTTKEVQLYIHNGMKKDGIYYWRVRAHHPDDTWDEWSGKQWFSYVNKAQYNKLQEEIKTKRQGQIDSQFSSWDGAHHNLTRLIKKSMNDPKSFEHIETLYWDMGDHLVVLEKFRGKNAFGGYVRNYVKAKVSYEGEILEIIEQDSF
jgi:tetratricopeptide (TPR) repeat protein